MNSPRFATANYDDSTIIDREIHVIYADEQTTKGRDGLQRHDNVALVQVKYMWPFASNNVSQKPLNSC